MINVLRGIVLVTALGIAFYSVRSRSRMYELSNNRKKQKCDVCNEFEYFDLFVKMSCGHYRHETCPNTCSCLSLTSNEFQKNDDRKIPCAICKRESFSYSLVEMRCGHAKHRFCEGLCPCPYGKMN